ncbi:MAG: ABC transporter ATP-binding protein [Lachnospira sp.]|jgi:ATP-binding cassette subfamily B protein|nr:ABC transporter ATP-binding protein [Lachnospira sp.]
MGRIIKNLKPYWKTIVIIVLLLILQAVCDLALPQYTSDIIDTGIQNSGVKHIIPEAIIASEYEKAQLFMTTQEKEQWISLYQQDNDIYRCKEKSEKKLDEYDSLLVLPLLIVGQMEEADATQMQQFSMMGSMPDEVIQQVRENTQKTIDTMGESFVHAMGVSYAVKQDTLAGLDIHSIQTRYLLIAGGKMVVMALLIAVTTVLVGLAASKVAAGIGRDMRVSVYKNVMSFSNAEMDKFSTASLITRTTNDIQQIQMVTVLSLRMVAYAPILGIGGIIKVMNTNSGMEWVIAVAVASIMCLVLLLMMIAMPKFKQMQKLVDAVNLVSREILTGLSVIRAFGREKKEEERFDNANKNLTKTMLFTNRVMTFMMPAMTLIMYGINVLIIWVAAHRIDEGVMQVGSMTAFITYTMQIVMSFLMLTMMSIFMPRAIVSANRIDEVLNQKSSVMDKTNPKSIKDKKGVVVFDHVHFCYPGAKTDAIEDINFVAEPGKTTAIIGSTGCGKTTLVNLIPRLYDVTKGSITIDGYDVRDISMQDLRSEIGYVPQKGVLFSGTIASNLRFGKDDATDNDIKEAASIAQATDFIESKEEQYEAHIAQGGTNVSGGQKQRLAIARAIAKNPRIYIFDDSFSALDLKTDATLRKALSEKMKESTMIIVAQRVSTIIYADQILVMDDGRIVGKGTHRELMKNCEVYQQIARSQMSEKELDIEGGKDNEQ